MVLLQLEQARPGDVVEQHDGTGRLVPLRVADVRGLELCRPRRPARRRLARHRPGPGRHRRRGDSFAPAGPDVVAPAAITNLTATQTYDTSLLLTWTAPGDDGASGTARTYDLRWSAQPITESSFASATPVAVQPVPMLSGTPQSYLVLSLTPGTRYYYAIRAIDEAGNLSALSNVAGPTTTASDVTAPAKIQDLSSAP